MERNDVSVGSLVKLKSEFINQKMSRYEKALDTKGNSKIGKVTHIFNSNIVQILWEESLSRVDYYIKELEFAYPYDNTKRLSEILLKKLDFLELRYSKNIVNNLLTSEAFNKLSEKEKKRKFLAAQKIENNLNRGN